MCFLFNHYANPDLCKENNYLQGNQFFTKLATSFEQNTSVHYEVVSHTDNSNLKFTVLL